MTMDYGLLRLRAQVSVLKDVIKSYPTCTIENAIKQIEARIKELESHGS